MRTTILLKTNEGGRWVLPQIEAMRARGHQVVIVLPSGNGRLRRELDAAGHSVLETTFTFSFRPRLGLLRELLDLRRLITSTRPDVLFYHLYASALAGRLSTLGTRTRRVHMVAGPLYLESGVIRLAERLLRRLDAQVIAGSEHTTQRYMAIGQRAPRLATVPYGVDLVRFSKGRDQRRHLFDCDDSTFVVIMVAYVYAPKRAVHRGTGIKGHEVLLDAWRDFAHDRPDSLLVFIGSGFDDAGERHRRSLIARTSGNATIRWIDSVDDVRPYYSSVDLSVSPSISENHGAALEASSMGLPSIVTNAGGLPETVTSESGWVVPAGDSMALSDALRQAESRYREGALPAMGESARAFMARRFDVAACSERVVEHIERVHQGAPSALVATEQRCWKGPSGRLLGQKRMQAAAALATMAQCTVVARRTDSALDGIEVLPAAWGLLIPWPSRQSGMTGVCSGLRELRRALKSHRVVLVFAPGILGTLAGYLALVQRKSLIVAAVGDPEDSLSPDVVGRVASTLARPLVSHAMRTFCKRAALVRYVTARTLQEKYPPGPATRAVAVSNVGQLDISTPRRGRSEPIRVLTVASLDRPYKGVGDLVEALALLRREGYAVHLTVVGTGRLEQELKSHASQLLGSDVHFTGHLTPEGVSHHYRRADIFVLASWTEGLPRALVEAMATGLPCVGTSVGGVPELLEDCHLAHPRDPRDLAAKIRHLIDDETAWQEASRRNVSFAREYISSSSEGEQLYATELAKLLATPR